MMVSSKKSRDLDYYFGISLKILCTLLMQSFMARAKLVQDLWSGDPFGGTPGCLTSKRPRLVRI